MRIPILLLSKSILAKNTQNSRRITVYDVLHHDKVRNEVKKISLLPLVYMFFSLFDTALYQTSRNNIIIIKIVIVILLHCAVSCLCTYLCTSRRLRNISRNTCSENDLVRYCLLCFFPTPMARSDSRKK